MVKKFFLSRQHILEWVWVRGGVGGGEVGECGNATPLKKWDFLVDGIKKVKWGWRILPNLSHWLPPPTLLLLRMFLKK